MSGQYPPPNPFTRAPLHQRPPPPWGHSSHPHPQSTGRQWFPSSMVGSSLNMYGSPHMGLGNHGGSHGGAQPWTPKPADTNTLMRLQQYGGLCISSLPEVTEPQEETMDLSSHSSVPEDGLKTNNDVLRNGTVVPAEVNGEVDRTETNSIVTSVIATNPLREGTSDTLNCFKPEENSVEKSLDILETPESLVKSLDSVLNTQSCTNSSNSLLNPQCMTNDLDSVRSTQCEAKGLDSVVNTQSTTNVSSDLDLNFCEPVNNIVSSVFKARENTVEFSKTESSTDRTSDLSENGGKVEPNMITNDMSSSIMEPPEPPHDQSHVSYFESSSLTIDTDESKLVVAESSTEDIFGLSPGLVPPVDSAQDDQKSSESNDQPNCDLVSEQLSEFIPVISESKTSLSETSSIDKVASIKSPDQTLSVEKLLVDTPPPVTPVNLQSVTAPLVNAAEPHPSVENVEILLESMFNSQEEDSSNLSNNNNGVPQSVIVSSAKDTVDVLKPKTDIILPMKEDELAKTLAEDNPVEDDIMNEIKVEKANTQEDEPGETIDEIQKELEMLIECKSNDPVKVDTEEKQEILVISETVKEEAPPCSTSKDVEESNIEDVLLSTDGETTEEQMSTAVVKSESPVPKPDPSSSSNPFIEVETQLEQMFAGIVEATDETGSDPQSQPSVSEPKKTTPNRRSVTKRKKANSRRYSDNSLFGGSSGESTPVKKKGRKRLNESGCERKAKKIKSDSADNLKKGKLLKEGVLDKAKGPFLHIEGSKESPASVVVVNSGVRADDDDGTDKTSARRKQAMLKQSEVSRRGLAYSSSTLSNRYNADTVDLTWVCVFCKRGPHCAGGLGGEPAGDLFGPYRIPATPPASVDDTLPPGTPSDREIVEEQKKRGGKYAKSLRASGGAEHFVQKISKKKRSMSSDGLESQSGLLAVDGGYEVWLHGPCAEWAPGLCIIGTQVVGLDDAVWSALNTRCAQCGEPGAGIGCTTHRCAARMHFHCASLAGWLLNADTFISLCNVHRTRLRPS